MSLIAVGPTGRIVRGDVLDVSKRALEERLRDYDSQVYLAWNPDKCRGYGCWELRRRPQYKTAIYAGSFDGKAIYELDYLETSVGNCVKDFAFLNYDILGWMHRNDMWAHKNYADYIEKQGEENTAAAKEKALAERKYNLRQYKNQIAGLRELALSGKNLAEIARYWGSVTSS